MTEASPKPLIALCWSVADEPAFFDALAAESGDFRVCPLRHCARKAVETLLPPEKVLPLDGLVSGAQKGECIAGARQWASGITQYFLDHERDRWLAVLDDDALWKMCYYALYWYQVLDTIQRRYPESRLRLYGPLSVAAPGYDTVSLSMDVLQALFDAHLWRRAGGDRSALPLSKRLRYGLRKVRLWPVRLMSRWPAAFMRRTPRALDSSGEPAPVLFFGLPPGDTPIQRDLVERWAAAEHTQWRWLTLAEANYHFQADEQADGTLSDERVAAATDRIPVERGSGLNHYAWRWAGWGKLASEAARRKLVRAALGAKPEAVSEMAAEDIAGALSVVPRQPLLEWRAITALLDRYAPRLLITSSAVEHGAMAALWARFNGCRHIRLPHGFELDFRSRARWLGDMVGVFGAHQQAALEQSAVCDGELVRIGGAHLGQQYQRASARLATDQGRTGNQVLMLMSSVLGLLYAAYPHEIIADVMQLARNLSAAGYTLVLRRHRGLKEDDYYKELGQRAAEEGLEILFSDGRGSLLEELRAARAAVISCWGGAGVFALLDKCPLIGYLPRPVKPDSDAVVERLPMSAAEAGAISEYVQRLSNAPDFRRTVLDAQAALLQELVTDPYGDPWARALHLIEAEWNAIK